MALTETDEKTSAEQPGVTDWYRAMQERLSERGSGWGHDCRTPVEALMFLALRMGMSEDVSFDTKMNTVRELDGEPSDVTGHWRAFTAAVMADGSGSVEVGSYRWRIDHERLECTDGPGSECEGGVEWHSLDPGVRSARPYCRKHWFARCDREQELRERYPVMPPEDFDPYYAGESWDEPD